MHRRDVVIIGGGISGLLTAYFLREQDPNLSIAIVNQPSQLANASMGNAGSISPFGKKPFADLDNLKLLLKKTIFDGLVFKSKFDWQLLNWLFHFVIACRPSASRKTAKLWNSYGQQVVSTYLELKTKLDDFQLKTNGFTRIYLPNEKKLLIKESKRLEKMSVAHKVFDPEDTCKLFPLLSENNSGGIFLQDNLYMNPRQFNSNLRNYLEKKNIDFIDQRAKDINKDAEGFAILLSSQKVIESKYLLIATGSDLAILKSLKRKLNLIKAKGYHFDLEIPTDLKPITSMLLNSAFVYITPRKENVRFTFKLELNAKKGVDESHYEQFQNLVEPYLPKLDFRVSEMWYGYRPLTPNDLPIFGRDREFANLIYVNGLGWQGNTFAPIVSKAVADLVVNEKKNEQSKVVMEFSSLINKY